MFKHISIVTTKQLLKLTIAGVIIGVFKSYDMWIAMLLTVKLIFDFKKHVFQKHQTNWVLFYGMVITGFLGIAAEFWGVKNGFWTYHEINGDFPLWLPMAWMLSFKFLYQYETKLMQIIPNLSAKKKWWLTFGIAFTIPAVGEMITIGLGVWSYHWPYQILGVPVVVFFLLAILHMFVYHLMGFFCEKKQWEDVVFGK